MRVGRPVKTLLQPHCNYCGAKASLVQSDEDGYPYREDHGALWLCVPCEAWIATFARGKRHVPLGRLANAELREWKAKLHTALEPLVAAKLRRDGCNPFEARAKAYRWLAGEMNMDEKACNIHLLDVGQCRVAIYFIERFGRERNARTFPKSDAGSGNPIDQTGD